MRQPWLNRSTRPLAALAALVVSGCLAGCAKKPPVAHRPWPAGSLPPSALPSGGRYAKRLAPVPHDPLNEADVAFMRKRSKEVLDELVAALPDNLRRLVEGIPLKVDDSDEVNAYAACREDGRSLMAITDGLMVIQAHMARAQATDDVFGTHKLGEYVQHVAASHSASPPDGFLDVLQDIDGRKVARQHELFDEEVAFVLGHELAHHYLSHTGCIGQDRGEVTVHDLGRVLSNEIPLFNQPNEAAADVAGVHNMLTAGQRRPEHRWTDQGAMLTLRFFLEIQQASPGGRQVFSFEASHPHPSLRMPIVAQTTRTFVANTGAVFTP